MSREFLSCDWGTSSFRIRWIKDGEIVREYHSDTGCKAILEQTVNSPEKDRAAGYSDFLEQVLAQWPPGSNRIPLVISGMASSSIGWHELPYAATPLNLNGTNLRFDTISWSKPPWITDTYLISGVATKDEIMRGEETEAIGLLNAAARGERCLLLLPGTHSKHLLVKDDQIKTFWTYMTGELFDVLARNSILKTTTDLTALDKRSPENFAAYDSGVAQAAKAGLEGSLFQTRTRAILKRCPAGENAWFLSGLLIGAEISDSAKRFQGTPILLGGAPHLRKLYARALSKLQIPAWKEFSDAAVEQAVPTAHAIFLEQQGVWNS